MSGLVSLVGAGPGDPGLLTLKGRDRLAEADVVIYDRLANPALLRHAPAGAELIFAGKSAQNRALSQDEINALLVAKARQGLRVVRLKGGDPFVFGRGGEEALALAAAGLAFEVVPGITSAIAAPAYAGVPVTHRGLAASFAVVTGHEDDEKEAPTVDWHRIALAVDTIVVLMGGAALASVAKSIIAAGRPPETPAVSVQWGTTNQQRSVRSDLAGIAAAVQEQGLGSPLLTVIGEVAGLRDHIAWFEQRPLLGKRILVTRTREQASGLSARLREAGAITIELPTLELQPVASEAILAAAVAGLAAGDYAWCLFSSSNAIDVLFAHLDASGLDARIFAGCKLAALGSATAAALKKRGMQADLVAREFSSDGLLRALDSHEVSGAKVLLPRGAGGSPLLAEGLRHRGALVDEIELYRAVPPPQVDAEVLRLVRAGKIDAVTFASSSAVRNLSSLLGEDMRYLRNATIACIGPVTSETAREHGLAVQVEPTQHTIPALVEALVQHFKPTAHD